MQTADESTVLGDFSGVSVEHGGIVSKFFRRADGFWVRTEGADGAMADFEIAYTFGVDPLQQYLVAFSGGRYQVLTLAWDSRPAVDGGQRWFSLYPEEEIAATDVLHWTGPGFRWNSMCAHCHSTELRKQYTATGYDTRWAEIDVACEACHGPGSEHVTWARSGGSSLEANGLEGWGGPSDLPWTIDPESGMAHPRSVERARVELDRCGVCHSRRSLLREGPVGAPLHDLARVALLDAPLYFADGQIDDEVYVYGSFVQSRMYQSGVRCSDCHDPHSLKLHREGDATCFSCHAEQRFASRDHHHHGQESAGAQCVACHMPERTYMVIDDRRDHSFRVPRPDLTRSTGSPNACNACHSDRDPQWILDAFQAWYPDRVGRPHFALAIHSGRSGAPGVAGDLAGLARDRTQPEIARATAIGLLPRYRSERSLEAIRDGLRDPDPLVRATAVENAFLLSEGDRIARVTPLLRDPVGRVRSEAGRVLATASLSGLAATDRDTALREYRESQRLHGDLPESHLNLGRLSQDVGRLADAERSYLRALEVGAYFLPTYVNLADLYRVQGRDAEAVDVLRQGLALAPDAARIHHALGLALVRVGNTEEAMVALRRAAELEPDDARIVYVYGVGLHSTGEVDAALQVLEGAHVRHPTDRSILEALVSIHRDLGQLEHARRFAEKLRGLEALE